jgi:hypothetical protein
MHQIQDKLNQILAAFYLVDSVEWDEERMIYKKVIVVGPDYRDADEPALIVPLFSFGTVVATPGALSKVGTRDCVRSLLRHLAGDWGVVDGEDPRGNVLSLEEGYRIKSSYRTEDGERLWIITEADRSVTTLLLPEEH